MQRITYRINNTLSVGQFIDLLQRSTLAARRPVNDPARIQQMIDHANLTITAWDGDRLVGAARSLTDFSYCCYLSVLAVDESYQRSGIGKELVQRTRRAAGEKAALILLSAPAAMTYYPKIGFEKADNTFIIRREN
jgi:predicted N-acetyltransferase YhbS